MHQYLFVFFKDVHGASTDREIEISFKLIPITSHVFKAPYGLAQDEFKELKAQLEEFFKKGVIRPIHSP